ncbi:MAG: acylphosphatase [Thermoproteota archaeon]|jgi:acylphosphatase|nr:acylphosphatase [Thermoproteota archaeon]
MNPSGDIKKKARVHVFISGMVQGVYFRQNTKEVATRHRVTGWVRNLPDGRVEAIFEGDRTDVDEVIEWCQIGPPKANVEDVDIQFENHTGEFANFSINNN